MGYNERYILSRTLQEVGEDELLPVSFTTTFSKGQGISTKEERQVSQEERKEIFSKKRVTKERPLKKESVQGKGLVKKGLVKKWLAKQELVKKGLANKGLAKKRFNKAGQGQITHWEEMEYIT